MPATTRLLAAESDTLELGTRLAICLEGGMTVYLCGELGAGKTTLARGILRALGHEGRVKSPSFALLEPYKLSKLYLYHFDFYRFNEPHEAAEAGFREYFRADSICLIEWPEKAAGALPPADFRIELRVAGSGREATIGSETEAGRLCLSQLQL